MNRGYTISVEEHPEVWDTVVELERKLNGVAGLLGSGPPFFATLPLKWK